MTMDNTKNTQNISKLVMDLISAPVEFALSSVPSTDDSYFIKMLKHERDAMYDTLIACSSWLNNGEGKVMYVRDWTNPIKDVVSITLSKDAIYITENQECRIRRCDLNKQEILTLCSNIIFGYWLKRQIWANYKNEDSDTKKKVKSMDAMAMQIKHWSEMEAKMMENAKSSGIRKPE